MEKNFFDNREDDFVDNTYKKLIDKLDKIKNKKQNKNIKVLLIDFFIAYTALFLSILISRFGMEFVYLCCGIVFSVFFSLVTIMIWYTYLEGQESEIYTKILEFESKKIQRKIQDDIFENSIRMSYKYLDQYYAQIKEQAQKGFFITMCVSIFGIILIGFGIVSMFMNNTNPSYITCASGVLTEFIATVFFYMYNKTVSSMSKYHNKLVLSHNISIALKVADTLPSEDKVKSKNLIISELLKDMNSHLIRSDSEDTKK